MTISEIFDEYIADQGGDAYLRSWLKAKLSENPALIDELLTEKLKKEIQQDVKDTGKKKKEAPPKIKD